MDALKFLLLFFVFLVVKAHDQIELQFLGDYISKEEATNRNLCDTKYCLSDANYLGLAATQNKLIRPCDDFKEFTVGTFIKYRSVNERDHYAGFSNDIDLEHIDRLRKTLEALEDEESVQITKTMAEIFAKCVDSNYVEKNGTEDVRKHAQSLGLHFYPDSNSEDFNLTSFIEKEPDSTLLALFQTRFYLRNKADPKDNINNLFTLQAFAWEDTKSRLESYADMLYDMNQIYLKESQISQKKRKEFREIADKQLNFYNELVR